VCSSKVNRYISSIFFWFGDTSSDPGGVLPKGGRGIFSERFLVNFLVNFLAKS